MGLGYSTMDNSQNEGVGKINKTFTTVVDIIQNQTYHLEVKKHLLAKELSIIKPLAIQETLIEELYPKNQDMVIIAGVFGPLLDTTSDQNLFMYVKIKYIDKKIDSISKIIQVQPTINKTEDCQISSCTEKINVKENYNTRKPKHLRNRPRKDY